MCARPVPVVAWWLVLFLALGACSRSAVDSRLPVRVGYFPNITHSQALVGVADGTFARALGGGAALEPRVFNAGPSVVEAIFAGQIDIAYVGPSPTINGYVRSDGQALRVVAGATSGGAVLVVRGDAGVRAPRDFQGKRVASPQIGNTQDVALRRWLRGQGLEPRERGGTIEVIAIANPDILSLMVTKQIDAAWVPEPWGARLVQEAGGRVFLDERDLWPDGRFVTAHVVARAAFLRDHPDVVRRWLDAHVELTRRLQADPTTAKRVVNAEIGRLAGRPFAPATIDEAWSRMAVTWDPVRTSLQSSAQAAFELGLLGDRAPRLDGLYDLRLLNDVLRARGLQTVR